MLRMQNVFMTINTRRIIALANQVIREMVFLSVLQKRKVATSSITAVFMPAANITSTKAFICVNVMMGILEMDLFATKKKIVILIQDYATAKQVAL